MSGLEYALIIVVGGILAGAFFRLRLHRLIILLLPVASVAAYIGLRHTILNIPQAVTATIFLIAYALIATESMHKTTVALGGAVILLLLGLVTQEEAFHGRGHVSGVDWNTIFLLVGMMLIVNIMRHTGIFEYVAIKSAKIGRGNPVAIMILISLATAILSACLDNVTTVLLTVPASLLICQTLQINPVPMVMCVILSSNIGGTATLIGDPPNIIIGSAGHLTFMDFLRIDAPLVAIAFAAFAATIWLYGRRRHTVPLELRQRIAEFDERRAITDMRLLRRSLFVFGVTLLGFVMHGWLHLEMATIALTGAALMLVMYRRGPEEALRDVEWPTIFFFIGLFIMVSALVKVGVVNMMGQALLQLTAGNVAATTMLVLWMSAFVSAIVGNVPFTTTMTALIQSMATTLHPEAAHYVEAAHAPDIYPLWWALSLGACLGGNLTLVGAAANLVGVNIAARAGENISFLRFMKYGVPISLQSLVLSSLWLWLLFLR